MKTWRNIALLVAVVTLFAWQAAAADLVPLKLPAPQIDGGKPLMQALKLRSTSRSFSPEPIPLQTLSDLLWAAWGINRPEEGKRTAPSARNWQEIDVIVVRADGAYLYDAKQQTLEPVASGDLRALAGTQDFVKDAPLTWVYVEDKARMPGGDAAKKTDTGSDSKEPWSWACAGAISQNVYLYCASEGLVTGVRAYLDRPALAKALGLGGQKVILMAQSVGFPKAR
jgi:nitroreductase